METSDAGLVGFRHRNGLVEECYGDGIVVVVGKLGITCKGTIRYVMQFQDAFPTVAAEFVLTAESITFIIVYIFIDVGVNDGVGKIMFIVEKYAQCMVVGLNVVVGITKNASRQLVVPLGRWIVLVALVVVVVLFTACHHCGHREGDHQNRKDFLHE